MTITDLLAQFDFHAVTYFMLVMGWDDIAIAFALMIVSATINALLTKRATPPKGPDPAALTDFDAPQIDEGTAQTVVFGDVWLTGWQVLWYGNLRSQGIPGPKVGKK